MLAFDAQHADKLSGLSDLWPINGSNDTRGTRRVRCGATDTLSHATGSPRCTNHRRGTRLPLAANHRYGASNAMRHGTHGPLRLWEGLIMAKKGPSRPIGLTFMCRQCNSALVWEWDEDACKLAIVPCEHCIEQAHIDGFDAGYEEAGEIIP